MRTFELFEAGWIKAPEEFLRSIDQVKVIFSSYYSNSLFLIIVIRPIRKIIFIKAFVRV